MTIELNRKYLTAKDLIEVLSKVPPETEIDVSVDEGSGYYTCQSEFGRIGIQYYEGMGLSLLVGDGHSKFDKDRISSDDE